ncbi:MAG: hypothetical protein OXF49_00105 [Candidatus Saccharibacteria bacterium]|nr:hypothetical protein [Candidatus Saccharibacteria bacterium]
MTYAHLTNLGRSRNIYVTNKNSYAIQSPSTKGGVSWFTKRRATIIPVIGILILLIVFYAVQVNNVSYDNYEINTLNNQKAQLEYENQALHIESMKLESNLRVTDIAQSPTYQLPNQVYFD